MKLDFLILASPTKAFFSQIAFFRLCLNALGGAYQKARLVAVFGDDEISELPDKWPWAPYFQNIEIEWVARHEFAKSSFAATCVRRYELLRDDADLAVLCDADVAPLGRFDLLARTLMDKPALAGVVAHKHFPWPARERDPDIDWPEIATSVIGHSIDRPYRYSLLGEDAPSTAPFYVNDGVLIGSPTLLREFYKHNRTIGSRVADIIGHWFSPQVSFALTCADLALPTKALPMRYNFPNDPIADHLYPSELQNAVFLHYLRLKRFDRRRIFSSAKGFKKFTNLKLTGSNLRFQEHVISVTNGRYPFER